MSPSQQRVREAIAEQAAEWFVANRERASGDDDDPEFGVWLRSSVQHVEAYLSIALIAEALPRAAALPQPEFAQLVAEVRSVGPLPEARWQPRTIAAPHLRRWLTAAAVAAFAGLAITALWPGGERAESQRYATRHGEQTSERLSDGTLLRLDTETVVTVRFTAAERRIYLERGQVRFEVPRDRERPLRVIAGGVEVADLGTVFDVYRREQDTRVTVIEGAVRVGLAKVTARTVQVAAGERLVVAGDVLPEHAEPVDVDRSTGWLRREIAFDRAPLAVVAAEFNRYGSVPIVIETPALRELAISGVFVADDTETFVAFLRSLKGVHVELTPGRIRVTQG